MTRYLRGYCDACGQTGADVPDATPAEPTRLQAAIAAVLAQEWGPELATVSTALEALQREMGR